MNSLTRGITGLDSTESRQTFSSIPTRPAGGTIRTPILLVPKMANCPDDAGGTNLFRSKVAFTLANAAAGSTSASLTIPIHLTILKFGSSRSVGKRSAKRSLPPTSRT